MIEKPPLKGEKHPPTLQTVGNSLSSLLIASFLPSAKANVLYHGMHEIPSPKMDEDRNKPRIMRGNLEEDA